MKRFMYILLMGILLFGNVSYVSAGGLSDYMRDAYGEESEEQSEESKENNSYQDFIDKNSEGINTEDANLEPANQVMEVVGFIISGIIVVIFAWMFASSAVDMLYIGVPPLRNVLYKQDLYKKNSTIENNKGNEGSNTNSQGTDSVEEGWETLKMIHGIFISSDMKILIDNGTVGVCSSKDLLKQYLKKRVVTIIFLCIIIMMFLASNVIFDTGWNLGLMILKFFGWE